MTSKLDLRKEEEAIRRLQRTFRIMARTRRAARSATWFDPVRLGQGRASAVAPAVPLTRRMAVRCLETEPHLDSIRSLRSAQALGLGGDLSLAQAVGYSPLACQLWDAADEAW